MRVRKTASTMVFLLMVGMSVSVSAQPCPDSDGVCEFKTALDGDPRTASFFSIQLRRISGTDYEIHLFDRTFDNNAFGRITVTDCDTGAVIIDKRYPASPGPFVGDFNNPGSFSEALTIPAARFSVLMESSKFSTSSIFFGDDRLAIGNPPTSQIQNETRCFECTPCSEIEAQVFDALCGVLTELLPTSIQEILDIAAGITDTALDGADICDASKQECRDRIVNKIIKDDDIPEGLPSWLVVKIMEFQNQPPTNPPIVITRWLYTGMTVYYIPPYCCDIFSELYNEVGDLLCAPSGGITGLGDGKCPDFFDLRTDGETVWQDNRK